MIKTVQIVEPDYVAQDGSLVLEVNSESDYGGPENPRVNGEFGHMLCWHRRANFGSEPLDFNMTERTQMEVHFARVLADELNLSDEQRYNVEAYCPLDRMINTLVKRKKAVVLPIYLFEHSGMSISTTRGYFDAIDPGSWDHGQSGIIYATETEIKKWLGKPGDLTDEDMKVARDELADIVRIYDMYLNGEAYCFNLYNRETEENIDSCGGIYAENDKDLKKAIREIVPEEYAYLVDKLEPQQ